LTRNLATPCLGREPKASVATFQPLKNWLQIMFQWGLTTLGWFHNDEISLMAHGVVI
jgi:hypothetical protein